MTGLGLPGLHELAVILAIPLLNCAPASRGDVKAQMQPTLNAALQNPATPSRPTETGRHGVRVFDDYTWLEQVQGEDVVRWLRQQDRVARSTLERIQEFGALRSEMANLISSDARVHRVSTRAGRTFFLRRDAGAEVDALYIAEDGPDPRKATLLLSPDRPTSGSEDTEIIDYYHVSPNGRLIAVGKSTGGSEDGILRIFDVERRRWQADEIRGAMFGALSWVNDESFVYWRRNLSASAEDPALYKNTASFLHRIGGASRDDVAVFSREHSGGDSTSPSFPVVYVSQSSPEFAWGYDGPSKEYDLFVARRSDLLVGRAKWQSIMGRDARIGDFVARGSVVYMLTYHGAPRGQVVALDVRRPHDKAKILVPEGTVVLENLFQARDGLYLKTLDAGVQRLRRYSFQEEVVRDVPLAEGISVSEVATDERRDGALLLTTSWKRSPQLLRYDPVRNEIRDTELVEPSNLGPADVTVTRIEVDVGDAAVPMTLIHSPNLSLNGKNPTKIIAYGSYGYTYLPRFLRQERAWLRRGGVIAYAHVRGGGERGDSWHREAVGVKKVVAVDDFIRCAEYLISAHYTSPSRLIASGASAGGIVVGAGIVRRPELFRAAVLNVPVVSILRFLEKASTGGFFEFEFGSLQREDEYRALLALDAYYSIQLGRQYPPVLLMAGMNDPRVPVWQPAKFAAKLQATMGRKALLTVDFDAGHGSQTAEERARLLADEDAFCWSAVRNPN